MYGHTMYYMAGLTPSGLLGIAITGFVLCAASTGGAAVECPSAHTGCGVAIGLALLGLFLVILAISLWMYIRSN